METYEQQTLPFGETASTCSQAVSPASRSVSQASARARRTTATSGRKCCGLFGLFDPAGSLAKTFTELLTGRKEWSSTRCVLTWKRQDTKCSRTLYRLAVSALPTDGTDAGLLQGLKQCEKGKTVFMSLELLPTPTAIDAGSGRINRSLSPGAAERPTLALSAKMGLLPAPTVNDAANSSLPASQVKRKIGLPRMAMQSDEYRTGTTSRLNPLYVTEMMGFPVNWLISPFLRGAGNPSKHAATP